MTAGIHFDSVGGASGDMILAALLDLGVESAWLEEQLAGLGVGPFRIRADESADRGIRGRRLALTLPDSPASSSSHIHPHPHGIGARLHGLLHRVGSRPQGHSHAPGGHRGLREIEAILNAAALPEPVRESSRTVFRRLAEVEAHIHGTTPDQVHFHEIGALDALADIVGANLARQALGVGWVSVAPLPIGRGTVACAHGILPLPAPATAALLTGFPVTPIDESAERSRPPAPPCSPPGKTGRRRPTAAGPASATDWAPAPCANAPISCGRSSTRTRRAPTAPRTSAWCWNAIWTT